MRLTGSLYLLFINNIQQASNNSNLVKRQTWLGLSKLEIIFNFRLVNISQFFSAFFHSVDVGS